MKRLFTLFLILVMPTSMMAQTDYAYGENDREDVFMETFDLDNRDYTNTTTVLHSEVVGGVLRLTNLDSAGRIKFLTTSYEYGGKTGYELDTKRDFELETSIRFISGTDNLDLSIIFGSDYPDFERVTSNFNFGYTPSGYYTLYKYVNSQYVPVVDWVYAYSKIKQYGFNILTVRKVSDAYYFFLNRELVYTMPFEDFFDHYNGILVTGNTTAEVDYFRISYLPEKNPPMIELIQPQVINGGKLGGTDNQLLIRGTVKDESGLQSFFINNLPERVDNSGYFESIVTLMPGNNYIQLKAIDRKQNIGSFYFSYYFEQGVSQRIPAENISPIVDVSTSNVQKRVALVIGIKSYTMVPPLGNTLNDAMDMSALLKKKGFEVIELYDPKTKRDIRDGVIQFVEALEGDESSVGMMYYSGHGMQVEGNNYLIPAEADLQLKADVEDQCMNVNYILRAMEEYENQLNIIILDACRNNPFRSFSRSGERGLSMVDAPKGSYIVYATKPGDTASDGTGRNGLFTSKLLKYIDEPGNSLEDVFKKVAADVSDESGDRQRPWISSDFTGNFYFTPGR